MNKRSICILFFVAIASGLSLGALNTVIKGGDDVVSVTATLENDTIKMADNAVLDIVYTSAKPIESPAVTTESEDVKLVASNQGGGNLKVAIEPLKPGQLDVLLRFEYKDDQGQDCIFGIGRITLNVGLNLTDEQIKALGDGDISSIIDPIEQTDSVESVPRDYRVIAIAAAIGVVILIVGFIIAAKRKKRAVVKPKKFVIVHNIAYQLLDDLKYMNLPHRGMFKLYYANLGNILRYYIEYRFDIQAPDMTTEEFLEKFRDSRQLGGVDKSGVEKFLAICDMVKFAKFEPTEQQATQAMDTVREFVSGSEDYQCVIEESIGARFGSILEGE